MKINEKRLGMAHFVKKKLSRNRSVLEIRMLQKVQKRALFSVLFLHCLKHIFVLILEVKNLKILENKIN